jgi:hypothetical protein
MDAVFSSESLIHGAMTWHSTNYSHWRTLKPTTCSHLRDRVHNNTHIDHRTAMLNLLRWARLSQTQVVSSQLWRRRGSGTMEAVERVNPPLVRPSPRSTCHEIFWKQRDKVRLTRVIVKGRQAEVMLPVCFCWVLAWLILTSWSWIEVKWSSETSNCFEIHVVTTLKTVFFNTIYIISSNVNWCQKVFFIPVTWENVQDSSLLSFTQEYFQDSSLLSFTLRECSKCITAVFHLRQCSTFNIAVYLSI